MLVRYESLERTVWQLGYWAFERLGAREAEGRATIFNPLPDARSGLVELAGAEPQVVQLAGFAARTVELIPRRAPEPRAGSSIQSDRLSLEAAPDGTLALTDKLSGRRYERLHMLEDEPDMGDLYNFCPVDGARVWHPKHAQARILADGPVVWELELRVQAERPERLVGDSSATVPLTIVTIARLVRGSSRVEFRTTVENHSRDHRLRAAFAAGESDETVRAESPFALVRRPLRATGAADRVDRAARRDRAQPRRGRAWTDRAPEPGPAGVRVPADGAREGEELCLTMLRCVGVISQPSGAIATRPQGAGPALATPEGQCLGGYELEYALVVGADQLDDLSLLQESADYRRGFVVVPGIEARLEPPLSLTGDVVWTCLKGAEDGDGLVLRCFNPSDSAVSATLSGPVSVARMRLDETREEPVPGGATEVAPHQIATLRIRPE